MDVLAGLEGEIGQGGQVELDLLDGMGRGGGDILEGDAAFSDRDIVERKEKGEFGKTDDIRSRTGTFDRKYIRYVVAIVVGTHNVHLYPPDRQRVADEIVPQQGQGGEVGIDAGYPEQAPVVLGRA